ncbi:DM13 domain-containing protein [Geodermatophilus sp. DSM 44513]|uniref:DM13 domain-containing protein n=1 Tax=Geodermatophilus sp. DSM 44513 TaxID=1528104 RepID=UPI0012843B1A|nr:DM13 domain-containing protein [Geodermatophilus sp. DSM 44513]WNV73958.1 DM13 domain-containing protein [Geodermatophilus sp. DSM 44513]
MRSRRLLPLAVAAAVLALLVLSPVELSALVPRTATGVLTVLALVVAVLVWSRLVVPRLTRRRAVRGTLRLLPVLALLAVLLVPALVDREVDEGLLEGVPVAVPMAGGTGPSASPAPPAPERLGAGPVRGVGHRASGEAVLYRAGGTTFVRLQDLDVQGAVDVVVYLVPGADQTDPEGGVDLGALKGTRGSANHVLPPGVDPADHGAVLLWCRAFSTPIAVATLV